MQPGQTRVKDNFNGDVGDRVYFHITPIPNKIVSVTSVKAESCAKPGKMMTVLLKCFNINVPWQIKIVKTLKQRQLRNIFPYP